MLAIRKRQEFQEQCERDDRAMILKDRYRSMTDKELVEYLSIMDNTETDIDEEG